MIWSFPLVIFIASAALLYISGELIITALLRLSRSLGLKEFVVAFFVMAFAASLPNLFVGITSAASGLPELSFGDIMGNNLIAMTLAVGVAVFFADKKQIPSGSETVQTTAIFTIVAAILPIALVADGTLGRGDGLALVSLFLFYLVWLFSKRERFERIYEGGRPSLTKDFKYVFELKGRYQYFTGRETIFHKGIEVFSQDVMGELIK